MSTPLAFAFQYLMLLLPFICCTADACDPAALLPIRDISYPSGFMQGTTIIDFPKSAFLALEMENSDCFRAHCSILQGK